MFPYDVILVFNRYPPSKHFSKNHWNDFWRKIGMGGVVYLLGRPWGSAKGKPNSQSLTYRSSQISNHPVYILFVEPASIATYSLLACCVFILHNTSYKLFFCREKCDFGKLLRGKWCFCAINELITHLFQYQIFYLIAIYTHSK